MPPTQLNITIKTTDQQSVFDGAAQILTLIRPNWLQRIHYKLITGGITNALVSCQHVEDTTQSDVVLVRIYGQKTELLIDREQEKRNIIFLHEAGIAPPLYATFNNGLVYKFVKGCILSQKTVIEPKIYKLVAAQLAKLHRVKKYNHQNGTKPILWDKAHAFLALVPDCFSDPKKQREFERCFPGKDVIERELLDLKKYLDVSESRIVFAHNDLLLGNIIFNEEESAVTFIDFEYAAANYQAYDIGNHFAEFIGTENIELDNYPNEDLQIDWLHEYLSVYNDPEPITDEQVYELYVQVNKFSLMAHLFWGIWSFIQAANSKIDFDFIGYGGLRLGEYFKKKNEFLSLDKFKVCNKR